MLMYKNTGNGRFCLQWVAREINLRLDLWGDHGKDNEA